MIYDAPVTCGRCCHGDVDYVDSYGDGTSPTWECGDCGTLYWSLLDATQGVEAVIEPELEVQPRPDLKKRRVEKCNACKQLTFQVRRTDGVYVCKSCLHVGGVA